MYVQLSVYNLSRFVMYAHVCIFKYIDTIQT